MLPPVDAFSNVANTWLHKLLSHTSNQYSNSFFFNYRYYWCAITYCVKGVIKNNENKCFVLFCLWWPRFCDLCCPVMRMWTDRSIFAITVNKNKKRKRYLTTKTSQFIWIVLQFLLFPIATQKKRKYIYISRTMYEKKTQPMRSPNSSRKFYFTSDQSWTIRECCTVTGII